MEFGGYAPSASIHRLGRVNDSMYCVYVRLCRSGVDYRRVTMNKQVKEGLLIILLAIAVNILFCLICE